MWGEVDLMEDRGFVRRDGDFVGLIGGTRVKWEVRVLIGDSGLYLFCVKNEEDGTNHNLHSV